MIRKANGPPFNNTQPEIGILLPALYLHSEINEVVLLYRESHGWPAPMHKNNAAHYRWIKGNGDGYMGKSRRHKPIS